jgi:SAM-dependent methyltransferase
MRKMLSDFIQRFPTICLLIHLFVPRVGGMRGDLQGVHDRFINKDWDESIAVDLGCGPVPQNRFRATKCIGVDLYEDAETNVVKARLGFERLPFEDGSVDYLTAYDLLEHIPRYADLPEHGNVPFIFLMNECYRVLRKGGVFLSVTPVYPYLGAFQDPTHNNIMTVDTLRMYFSDQKREIAKHYGITANFEVCYQKMFGQHLIAVLRK